MSVALTASANRACPSCGVAGPSHASDADCVAALQAKLEQLNAFVESLAEQRARRSRVLSTAAKTLRFPHLY